MSRLALLAVMLAAGPLAACDSAGDGTSISINANRTDGNAMAAVDGATGQVKIDVPGFEGSFKIPKIELKADAFDLNGVHLYPGSTISAMNIDPGADKADEIVKVSFDSPATPAVVREWFRTRLDKAGFTISADGTGLSGRTEEDRPFRLRLDPQGADRAKGTITVG